ncbi:oligosaccharide flippase family protein, partial [Pluralibacter gergoviae]|nr:oligosaccharide flippase family protein [Pluralibacter gergoviae]
MIPKKNIKVAAIWSGIEALSSVALSLISIVYLARILEPTDFGNIAMAQIIAALLGLFFSFGFTEAIIQRKILTSEIKETAFSASILFSLGAIFISFFVWLVLRFYLKNILVSNIFIFEVLGVVFNILSILPTAILLRELKMSSFTKRTLISRLMFFVVSIPLASEGFGVWSVVYGNFSQSIVSMILLFIATKNEFPKKLGFDSSLFKQLFKFGFYVMAENILWNVLNRVFSLLIAAFHGTYALGLYNIATRITDAVLNVLNTVVSRMALPLFSQVQDDISQLKDIFSKSTRVFNTISMPAFVGMAITCNVWVPIILGENWIDAIPIIQAIAIMYAIMYSRIFVGTAMKAVGQSKRFMILSAISAVLSVITVYLTRNMSLIDTMISWAAIRITITIPIGVYLMTNIIGLSCWNQFRPVTKPVLASGF